MLVERVGFEPTHDDLRRVGLANRCLEPLGHLSDAGARVLTAEPTAFPFVPRRRIYAPREVGPVDSRAKGLVKA